MLLDTHLLHWYAYDPARLPAIAAKQFKQRAAPLFVSWASLWELAIKSSLGRDDFKVDINVLHKTLVKEGFTLLPLSIAHLQKVAALPLIHRDPFDRLLVAQAAAEGLVLLTCARPLAAYGPMVKVV